ncbi:MAG: (S)-2-hydroxy-acid oxidase [Peptococcaceae bacterium BRH_c4a]|nr:MAG: (S)-2-hydroxy-acid oxidase [Peptococcaceae bacterium BRH_c4a]
MNWNELRQKAKVQLEGFCRVCPICDGRACAGEVPGMGGTGTGSSFRANLQSLEKYRVNLRTLHDASDPDTGMEIFGRRISFPILAAPLTGASYNMGGKMTEREFIGAVIKGSRLAGTVGMCGDGGDPGFFDSGLEAIAEEEGCGIAVIKPRDNKAIMERAARAEKAGALAVGVDVDGAGLVIMASHGQPVGPKSQAQLSDLVSSVGLPFIVKGVMTGDEAVIAARAGAAAIVVSNHGGRILDHTPGAADVLPRIAAEVKGSVVILADGGVRSGLDVLKLLALGADAVLVGRPVVMGAFGAGPEGVKLVLQKMASELKQAMILTGCSKIQDISSRVICK